MSPNVDLVEVDVRGLYHRWKDANKDKQEKEEFEEDVDQRHFVFVER